MNKPTYNVAMLNEETFKVICKCSCDNSIVFTVEHCDDDVVVNLCVDDFIIEYSLFDGFFIRFWKGLQYIFGKRKMPGVHDVYLSKQGALDLADALKNTVLEKEKEKWMNIQV